MAWLNVEHQLNQFLKKHSLQGKRLLLAISGGADSIALLNLLSELREIHQLELLSANVHHGGDSEYRARAAAFCAQVSQQLKIPFFALGPSQEVLSSEADLRSFRYKELEALAHQQACDFIVTAHHAQDRLETQLINLIRGTGIKGLQSLSELEGNRLRPLLAISAEVLRDYLQIKNLQHLEDPTNQETRFLRNWLRLEWLPALEKKQPGATKSLARSLETLSERFAQADDLEGVIQQNYISRVDYLRLNPEQKSRVIAELLYCNGYRQFSSGQIKEIQKSLDKENKIHSFKVGPMLWSVNAEQIIMKLTEGFGL